MTDDQVSTLLAKLDTLIGLMNTLTSLLTDSNKFLLWLIFLIAILIGVNSVKGFFIAKR